MKNKLTIALLSLCLVGNLAFGWLYRGDDGKLHREHGRKSKHYNETRSSRTPRAQSNEPSLPVRAARAAANTAEDVADAADRYAAKKQEDDNLAEARANQRKREVEKENKHYEKQGRKARHRENREEGNY